MGSALFLATPEHGTLHRVNETVAALWNLLAEPTSVEDAVAVFRSAFPKVAPARLEADVVSMFHDLLAEGLIESVEE